MSGLRLIVVAGLAVAAAPPQDAFDLAVQAIAAGNHAATTGDLVRLRSAAWDLRASGAAPTKGDDIAAQWLRQAHAAPPPPSRDRALGPGYRSLELGGGAAARFEQTFLAGQRARVTVVPARRSDFAMRVIDDNHAVICRATPRNAKCDWVPSYTTRFRIEVENPGRQPGRYFLILQ